MAENLADTKLAQLQHELLDEFRDGFRPQDPNVTKGQFIIEYANALELRKVQNNAKQLWKDENAKIALSVADTLMNHWSVNGGQTVEDKSHKLKVQKECKALALFFDNLNVKLANQQWKLDRKTELRSILVVERPKRRQCEVRIGKV